MTFGLGIFASILASIFNFWNKLPPTIKIVILLILFTFAGFLYGRHVEKVKCEAQKQESIAEARRIDQTVNATAFKDMEADKEKYRKQSLESENKLIDAATAFQELKEECSANEEFVKRNNDDLGSELTGKRVPKQIPSSKSRPTPHK